MQPCGQLEGKACDRLEAAGLTMLMGGGPSHQLAEGGGPRRALARLKRTEDFTNCNRWKEEARVSAIMGSCICSLPSVRSGVRCYIAFIGMFCSVASRNKLVAMSMLCTDALEGPDAELFPPKLDNLLAWTTLFRCGGTVSNYLGYVKTGTILLKASTEVRCVGQ